MQQRRRLPITTQTTMAPLTTTTTSSTTGSSVRQNAVRRRKTSSSSSSSSPSSMYRTGLIVLVMLSLLFVGMGRGVAGGDDNQVQPPSNENKLRRPEQEKDTHSNKMGGEESNHPVEGGITQPRVADKLRVVEKEDEEDEADEEDELFEHRQLQDDPAPPPVNQGKQYGSENHAASPTALFLKKGKVFYVTSRESMDLHDRLPTATYSVGVNPVTGEYFLQLIDNFDIHGKVYGETPKQADRILSTFLDRKGSTGVLLSGEKGSGKTFLAKYIAVQAAREHDIPTIVVNQPLSGEGFNTFIQSIQQPVVFLFDEFEKIYSETNPRLRAQQAEMEAMQYGDDGYNARKRRAGGSLSQDKMLTLLDGTYSTKMLFILTTNNKFLVSYHMRNRPGRIFYVIDFTGLSQDFIKEYCQDKLKDQTQISQVVAISTLFEAFSFDMLQALVEEMNRYSETPEQALVYLNARPEFASGARYAVQLFVRGQEIAKRDIHSGHEWFGQPLLGKVQVYYQPPRPKRNKMGDPPPEDPMNQKAGGDDMIDEDLMGGEGGQLEFTPDQLQGMDDKTGVFWYWNEEKQAKLILTKVANNLLGSNKSMLQKLSSLRASGAN